MGLAGDGPWALGVMWMLVGLVFLLLGLRLYTRIVCLASYGLDDHIYIVAFVRSLFPSENSPPPLPADTRSFADFPPHFHHLHPSSRTLRFWADTRRDWEH